MCGDSYEEWTEESERIYYSKASPFYGLFMRKVWNEERRGGLALSFKLMPEYFEPGQSMGLE